MRPNEIGAPGSPVYGFVNLLLSRSMLDCFQDGRRVYLARRPYFLGTADTEQSDPRHG